MTTVTDAVFARIQSSVPAGVGVYDGAVPGVPAARYVVLYSGSGWLQSTTMDGLSRDETTPFQVTTVASSPDMVMSAGPLCRALARAVRDALVDFRPAITGCGPVEHVYSLPPIIDESVKDRPTVYAVDQYSVLSDRK